MSVDDYLFAFFLRGKIKSDISAFRSDFILLDYHSLAICYVTDYG